MGPLDSFPIQFLLQLEKGSQGKVRRPRALVAPAIGGAGRRGKGARRGPERVGTLWPEATAPERDRRGGEEVTGGGRRAGKPAAGARANRRRSGGVSARMGFAWLRGRSRAIRWSLGWPEMAGRRRSGKEKKGWRRRASMAAERENGGRGWLPRCQGLLVMGLAGAAVHRRGGAAARRRGRRSSGAAAFGGSLPGEEVKEMGRSRGEAWALIGGRGS